MDKNEISFLSKFLASPIYNKKVEVRRMFDAIRKYHPDFTEKNISREKVMGHIFPGKPFDLKKYKYYSNLLLKSSEQFISMLETNRRPMIQEYHLLTAYEKRNVGKNFNFILKKTEKELNESQLKDSEFYYKKYLLKKVSNKHFAKKKERKNNNHLQDLISSFDLFYMANKLKYSCHIINNQNIITGDIKHNLTVEVISFLKGKDYSEHPAIHLYYNLYRLLTEEANIHFENIKTLLPQYENLFSKEELKEVNFIIINFCIRQLRKGNKTNYYLEELYRMYQFGIQAGFLLEEGQLSPWTFKNVSRLGLRLEKFNETEEFIRKNLPKLKEEFRSDAYHFSMADLHYYQGHPKEALSFLLKVEFSDIYYILGTKEMNIKIFYELGEMDALESLLDSFQNYLRRNKTISDNAKISFMNFIKIMTKVLKGNTNSLKQEIENTSPLMAKSWLLENVV